MKKLLLIALVGIMSVSTYAQTLGETGHAYLRNSSSTTSFTGTKTKLTLTASRVQTSGYHLTYELDSNPRVGRISLDNNWGAIYGDFAVSLRNSSGTHERFRITHKGNIGIGTTNPSSKLQVSNLSKNEVGLSLSKSFSGGGEGFPVAKFNFTDGSSVTNTGVEFGVKRGGLNFDMINIKYNSKTLFKIKQDGNIYANGTIHANEIKVESKYWADFVFDDDYRLPDLSEVENYINTNKHLPDVPSAATIEKEGVNVAEMNKLLLQKVEELTLYTIQKDKEVKALNSRLEKLETLLKY